MSNSIWHKRDETPKDFCDVVLSDFKTGSYCVFLSPFHDLSFNYDRWCYFDELLAQADKAERLQKAVDNSREKLAAFMHDIWGNWFAYQLNNSTVENLQRWGIQSSTAYSSLTETDKDKDRKFADKIIEIIKDEIKQLIKDN